MPQEDNEAAKLKHGEKVGLVIFPAAHKSAEVVEPSEETLDFPAAAVAAQFAAVLSVLPTAIVLVGRDQPDTMFLPKAVIERITVVGAVADHSFWFGSRETLLDGGVDERFRQIEFATRPQIFGERVQEPGQRAVALPLLKSAMAGLVGWIAVGQIVPRSTSAQDPKNPVQHGSRIAPRPTSTVGASFWSKQGFELGPLRLGQIHAPDLR